MSAPFSLRAHDLVRIYGDRRVLDNVSLTAAPGQRLGLVGENGSGKSTLLHILAGVREPDGGQVIRPPDTGFLPQESPYASTDTVADVLDDALADINARLRRLDELAGALDDPAALAEYGEVLDWLTAHEAWDADRRATLVLAGLGLSGMERERSLARMSGGQRSRLALAALLIRQPEAVLLDEPTNHLDDPAIAFLEKHLAALPGVVILSSHDRVFLDAVCTDIVDLDPALSGPTRYGGSYLDYRAAKKAERQRWEQRYAAEQEELKELRHAVAVTARQINHHRPMRDRNKMSYGMMGDQVEKQISRRVRNAQQRLDDLIRDQVRKPPPPLNFSGTLTSTSDGDYVLSARSVQIPGRLKLDRLDLSATTKLLITGENGTGKSTLLSVLAGTLAPESGTVTRRPSLRVGLLAQDVHFARPEETAAQTYEKSGAKVPLGDLGLLPKSAHGTPVGALSTGQRRRLALAMLIAQQPQLLLLDEPTNHLSPTLAEELEQALQAAPGAIVIATHDRWLRRNWPDQELRLPG